MLKILCATYLGLVSTLAQAAIPFCEEGAKPELDRIAERVILMGETHGTEQAPAFVAHLVCSLLAQNRPVILALERDESEQVATERFLSSAGSADDIGALLSQPEWNGSMQDGRSSQAVFNLLEQVRKWRDAGQRVEVLMMRKLQRYDVAATVLPRRAWTPRPVRRSSTWTWLTALPLR
jgi:hypothetical protein